MKFLAVDSSAKSASVAVIDNERLISESFVNIGLTHSETLMPMIDGTLKSAGLTISDIDSFCITVGPGSFTGIRIGLSAIKGLAQPSDKPCYGVSTLDAMVYNADDFNGIICCVMDARCSQVYNALFECKNKEIKRLTPDVAISLEELYNKLNEYDSNILLTGDGAEISFNYLKDKLSTVCIASALTRFQRAYGAFAAVDKLGISPCSANELNPVYLRPSQAERELKKKKEN